ncbi:MAG: type II/IV secretion system protein [Planctomycetia bacterium]|nr:type II/IV secretion system protein [Planctomycetia bacterium]
MAVAGLTESLLGLAAAPPLVPLAGMVSYPSFSGFPLGGLALWLLFVLTGAGGLAAAVWMRNQDEQLAIPHMEWWKLAIGLVLAGLLVGTMQIGPAVSITLSLAGLVATLVFFTRARDKRVPPDARILTKKFVDNLRAGVRRRSEARKAAAAAAKAANVKPPTLSARLKAVGTALQQSIGRKKAQPEPPAFMFLKKDGRPAFAMAAPGEDKDTASANVQAAEKMLTAAMRRGATDIHFEPHDNDYHVRYRVDGVLHNVETMPMTAGKGVISALKVVSDMDIAERRRPQDGTFAAVLERVKYDVRAASTPTSYGEKMVLRLLNSSGGVMQAGLANIGLRSQILEQLREVIHKPYGMFLVTGPTGSGKTTTVYASLSEIDRNQHNITTIEDPVEYRLNGITQIAVNSAAGVTFAAILRSVLRQDPDVLLVGEIRDKETAEIACQAALTGHFVFSTLHANDTVATITRMLDLGLDPMLIQTAVTAVLGQRLARKLCPACKEAYAPPPEFLKKFGIKPGTVEKIFREKGCEECGGSGYRGRMGLHELLVMNDDVRKLITAHPSVQDLKAAARKSGTRSLQSDGIMKVLKGVTSINEVVRVTT